MAAFEWTGERERASELLAARNLTHQEIADSVGIARSTLWEWRRIPEFAARVEEITEENRAETRRIGIADKERRLAALNDRWARMRRVIEERADDPGHRGAPGGSTGLLVRTIKSVRVLDAEKDDPKTAEVVEFAVDTGLLRELREIEKQAAVELGQWNEAAPGEATRVDELIREIRAGTQAANLVGEGR
jgi:transcriptional regulator with XRE-family HTH domain